MSVKDTRSNIEMTLSYSLAVKLSVTFKKRIIYVGDVLYMHTFYVPSYYIHFTFKSYHVQIYLYIVKNNF